jgi:hypothetical protein
MDTHTETRTDTSARRTAALWIGLVLAAIVTVVGVLVVDWMIMFGQSSTCGDAPDPDEVRSGRLALGIVVLVSALPWSLGAAVSRRKVPVVVVGSVVVLPGLLLFLNGLRTDAWVGSFCF